MKKLTHVLIFFIAILAAANSYTDDLSDAEDDYLNGLYDRALRIFLPHATPGMITPSGDLVAQYYLGEMFYYGEGVEQSYAEAMRWYLLSAEQGDPDAAYSIGFLYENGEGVEQSLDLAVEWYKRGIDLGSEEAFASLGLLYVYDEGEHRNIDIGLEMLREGAQSGNLEAQYFIGSIYYDGDVVEQDLNTALRYFRMAEAQGDSEALEMITWLLDEEQFTKNYDGYVTALRLSPSDENAFKCENFVWNMAYGFAIIANESGDIRLLNFAERVLARVNRFGQSLEGRLYGSDYESRQEFREIDSWLTGMYEESNVQLKSKNKSELSFEELILLGRHRTGVFEIVFHEAYQEYLDSIDDDRLLYMWDECVTRHLPDGLFRRSIGLDALIEILDPKEEMPTSFNSASDWSKTALRRISELSACEGDFDLAGGVAIGTAATALVAAPSVTTIATSASTLIATETVLLVFSQSAVLVAVVPAVATGIMIAAVAGSTIYATAKGYCYFAGR